MNNLKQATLGFIVWVNDNEQSVLPFRAEPMRSDPNANNAWVQFYNLREELNTPKIIHCPSDKAKRPAPFVPKWKVSEEAGTDSTHETLED